MIVILSYFHTKIGPLIFYSYPKKQLDKEISSRIYDIMDQPNKEEFLTQSFEDLKLLNYYFQIRSEWARGSSEMLMLSFLTSQQISPEIEESVSDLCKRFSEKMQLKDGIFSGFHIKELDNYEDIDKERIRKNDFLIKSWVQELYWEVLEVIRKISEEEKINLLLDDRYIFESLEKMSIEVKKISIELNSRKELIDYPIINDSVRNLNNIIDDLYEGYIEKMTEVNIEDEKSLFSPEEESDLDNQKSKKELLSALMGEFNSTERKRKKKI
ncbi:MAG: hypothetical protein ACFFE5_02035 [Candidatus Thorarchaeota archaeon]